MSELTLGQKLHAVHAKRFRPNGWVDQYPSWDDYDANGQAAWELMASDFLALLSPLPEGWRPIATAPKDGTLFLACNLDHPSFGTWPMYRRVRHTFEGGEAATTDLGAWVHLNAVEPDYLEGHDTGPEPAASIAPDDLNASVRYGWMPLPALSVAPSGEGKGSSQGLDQHPCAESGDAELPGWRPIETAPKDGIILALYEPYAETPAVTPARWVDGDDGGPDQPAWGENWMSCDHGGFIDPTHWMPLPEPPTDRGGAE